MNNDTLIVVVSAVSLTIGGFGQWLGKFIMDSIKNKREDDTKKELNIVTILQAQIDELRSNIKDNRLEIRDLYTKLNSERELNAALTQQVKDLQNRLNIHIAKSIIPEDKLNANIAKSGDSGIIK